MASINPGFEASGEGLVAGIRDLFQALQQSATLVNEAADTGRDIADRLAQPMAVLRDTDRGALEDAWSDLGKALESVVDPKPCQDMEQEQRELLAVLQEVAQLVPVLASDEVQLTKEFLAAGSELHEKAMHTRDGMDQTREQLAEEASLLLTFQASLVAAAEARIVTTQMELDSTGEALESYADTASQVFTQMTQLGELLKSRSFSDGKLVPPAPDLDLHLENLDKIFQQLLDEAAQSMSVELEEIGQDVILGLTDSLTRVRYEACDSLANIVNEVLTEHVNHFEIMLIGAVVEQRLADKYPLIVAVYRVLIAVRTTLRFINDPDGESLFALAIVTLDPGGHPTRLIKELGLADL